MGIFNKTNAIELKDEDLKDAKSTAAIFTDDMIKHRSFANVIAARSALKLLFSLNIDATNLYSMYSINKILERIDIADVYVGNLRIDARLIGEDGEIFIPKSHFNLGIVPDLYVVFKINKEMSAVEFMGCINPEEMDKSRENKDYYFVDEDILYGLKIFKNLVKNGTGHSNYVPTEEEIERAENLIIPLEDGEIFNADYEFFIKQLASNVELRKKTVEFENFEFISQKVVTEETIYGDSVLGLIGSEKLYNRNEFTSDIDLQELVDESVDSFVDDFNELDYVAPHMDEVTGEISLDEALSQMDDDFELNSDSEIVEEVQENESSSDEDLNAFINEMSDFSSSDDTHDISLEHKLSDNETQSEPSDNYEDFVNLPDDFDSAENDESSSFTEETSSNENMISFDSETDDSDEEFTIDRDDEGDLLTFDEDEDENDDEEEFLPNNEDNDQDLLAFDNDESDNEEEFLPNNEDDEQNLLAFDNDESDNEEEFLPNNENDDQDLLAFDNDENDDKEEFLTDNEDDEQDLLAFDSEENESAEESATSNESKNEDFISIDDNADDNNFSQFDDIEELETFDDNSDLNIDETSELELVEDISDDSGETTDFESTPKFETIEENEDEGIDFSQDTPINFDDTSDIDDFTLPDLDNFSLDDADDFGANSEPVEQNNTEDLANKEPKEEAITQYTEEDDEAEKDIHIQEEINSAPQNAQQNSQQTPTQILPFDDDIDMADLPMLSIVHEDAETFKKKVYTTPKIDDIDLSNVNLDDFDDYENEDKEEEAKHTKEIDDMMSDLEDILNSENISLEGVNDILTDEELAESLRKLEEEQNKKATEKEAAELAIENSNNEENSEETSEQALNEFAESSESAENTDASTQDENASGMSLDDFLNSSSFNDMSTSDENSDNIENNNDSSNSLDDLYANNNVLSEQPEIKDNSDILLTDEASMVDNSTNKYSETDVDNKKATQKPKSRAPQLAVVLVVLMCACVYVNKDIIMENFDISFPQKAEEPAPEFDLNSLREPQPPAEAPAESPADQNPPQEESPIPSIPQPTDMPAAAPEPQQEVATAQAPPTPSVAVPQNTSNRISKLSWEVPEALANNEKVRKYLQIAGRTLKLSLQNDILVATELPFSNKVMLDIKIVPSGNIVSSDFIISSGSKQIDNIVLQSVKDTFKYVRPPLGEIQSPNSNFTLIINF